MNLKSALQEPADGNDAASGDIAAAGNANGCIAVAVKTDDHIAVGTVAAHFKITDISLLYPAGKTVGYYCAKMAYRQRMTAGKTDKADSRLYIGTEQRQVKASVILIAGR